VIVAIRRRKKNVAQAFCLENRRGCALALISLRTIEPSS
jgi:hypothetical protein